MPGTASDPAAVVRGDPQEGFVTAAAFRSKRSLGIRLGSAPKRPRKVSCSVEALASSAWSCVNPIGALASWP